MSLLAVDIGGTKIAMALVTPQGGISDKQQQPTDLTGPQAVIEQIAGYCRQVAAPSPMDAVGVSLPAVLEHDTDRVIWAPNLPGWRDLPFREMLQDRLGVPVFIEYDGHAAALGEWWVGAALGYQHVACVIIGTGIGGGFIVDGCLWRGRDRLAGAVGWVPLAGPDGIDHWENLATGPAIARRVQALIHSGEATTLAVHGLTARDVFEAARRGDSLARSVIEETAGLIGQGVAAIISLVNPQIVVLGGGVGQQGDLLLKPVQETASRWAQPISGREVSIVSSSLGEEAGLLGAAYAAFLRLSADS